MWPWNGMEFDKKEGTARESFDGCEVLKWSAVDG